MHSFRIWFWVPLSLVLLPSTTLHIRLLVLIWRYRHKETYNSPFYRLFFVQSIIELVLMYIYHVCGMIVRDRIFGDDFLIASNEGIFSEVYYFGTIYFFHHVQVWGVIIRSFSRFLAVCAPVSRVERWLEICPSLLWAVINLAAPFAIVFRLLLHEEDTFFEKNENGIAVLRSPPNANGTQATIVSVVGTMISATCFGLVLRKLHEMRSNKSVRKYRQEKKLTFVGFTLFISLCTMTVYYLIVTFAAVENEAWIHAIRPFYIVPVMLLTFVNPWMLTITNRELRARLFGKASIADHTCTPTHVT